MLTDDKIRFFEFSKGRFFVLDENFERKKKSRENLDLKNNHKKRRQQAGSKDSAAHTHNKFNNLILLAIHGSLGKFVKITRMSKRIKNKNLKKPNISVSKTIPNAKQKARRNYTYDISPYVSQSTHLQIFFEPPSYPPREFDFYFSIFRKFLQA